ADAPRYGAALASLTADAADSLLVILTAQATTDAQAVARTIASHVEGWSIPVTTAFVGGPHVAAARSTLERAGLPCYPFPERAMQALGRAAELAERQQKRTGVPRVAPTALPDSARRSLATLRTPRGGVLGMSELAPLLEAAGIPVVATRLAATPA